jgi:hypothetical protein
MPLCPQITNTPITVTQTADFTVSSVLPVVPATTTQVNTANAAAAAALAEAEQALADAAIAISTANAANVTATDAAFEAGVAQSTADGKNTIYYGTGSTPGTGGIFGASGNGTTITYNAYNGLVVGQTVTVSGIANNTASITNASGNGTTVTYTASNNFAIGQTVTVSGINPSRWDGTGVITAANASSFSIAGTTTGTPAYISGGNATAPSLLNTTGTVATQSFSSFTIASTRRGNYTSGGSLNVTGLTFKVGDIYFQYNTSRQVIAQSTYDGSVFQSTPITNTVIANLDAGKITAGTITGIAYNNGSGTFSVSPSGNLVASSAIITGQITATSGSFTGAVFASSGSFTGSIFATSGYIGSPSTGWQFTSSGYLYSGDTTLYPTTSPGGDANTYSIFTGRGIYAERAYITNTTATAVFTLGGLYANGSVIGGAGAFTVNSSGSITAVVDIAQTGTITGNIGITSTGTITSSGNIITNNHFYTTAASTTGNAANAFINTGSTPVGRLMRSTASSIRYKENITDIRNVAELDPKKMLNIPVRAFSYKSDYLFNDDRAETLIPGLIAEEVDAIYPLAADYVGGQVESINDRAILVNLLALVQDLYKEIAIIKGE